MTRWSRPIRVILAHAYFHIDRDIVSGVITGEIPRLRLRLMAIADRLGEEGEGIVERYA